MDPMDIMMHKLRYCGFSELLLGWVSSFVSLRRSNVIYNGFRAEPYICKAGVPQGSCLTKLFFVLYCNELPDIISTGCLMYADDVKLFHRVVDMDDCRRLQEDLNNVVKWANSSLLMLNLGKYKSMSYARIGKPIIFNYEIGDSVLSRVSEYRDLGVVFRSDFEFGAHIEFIIGRAMRT